MHPYAFTPLGLFDNKQFDNKISLWNSVYQYINSQIFKSRENLSSSNFQIRSHI
jgi:hypothetical protein